MVPVAGHIAAERQHGAHARGRLRGMICPGCGALVGTRTMDFNEWVMRCAACGRVSPLPGEPKPELATKTARPEPLDEHIEHSDLDSDRPRFVEHEGTSLLAFRWIKQGALRLLALACVPLFLLMSLGLLVDSSWIQRAFGVFGLSLTYFALAAALKRIVSPGQAEPLRDLDLALRAGGRERTSASTSSTWRKMALARTANSRPNSVSTTPRPLRSSSA